MTLTDFISKVRLVLDMDNSTALISAGDTDAAYLDAIIKGNAVPAAKEMVSVAPARLLVPGTLVSLVARGTSTSSSTTDDNTSDSKAGILDIEDDTALEMSTVNGATFSTVSLPDDFYRLLDVKAKSWERPGKIIYDDDAEYALQKSKWAGLRGNTEAPVAVLVKAGKSPGHKLELYPAETSTGATGYCLYCPVPSVSEGNLVMPSKLSESIVYACASLTAETFGNASLAERYMLHAYRLAEITTKNTDNNGDKE